MESIFFQYFLFFLFKLFSELPDFFIILLKSSLSFLISQILLGLIVLGLSVVLFFFIFPKVFPVINNHSINLLDLYIWLFFGQFFESFFEISTVAIDCFSPFGKKLVLFLEIFSLPHSDVIQFLIVLLFLIVEFLPLFSDHLGELKQVVVAFGLFFAVSFEEKSHVGGEGTRWGLHSGYPQRIFEIFPVLLETVFLFSCGH